MEEREIYNASIHRFSYIKQFMPNEVDVDITENSIAVDIRCADYKGFDSYKRLIGILWFELLKHSPFLDVKRIGIRKICAFFALNGWEFREKVEEKVFPDPFVNENSPHCIHIDNFFWKEKLINCSLTRELQTGWTEIDNIRKNAFQFSLDYDLYVEEKQIKETERWKRSKSCQDIEIILEELNDLHFFLFKESISTKYLISLCNDR